MESSRCQVQDWDIIGKSLEREGYTLTFPDSDERLTIVVESAAVVEVVIGNLVTRESINTLARRAAV